MKAKRLRAIIIGLTACALLVAGIGLVSAKASGRAHIVKNEIGNAPIGIMDQKTHDAGLLTNPCANFLWEGDTSSSQTGGVWPAGSGNSYLYLSTYWLGTIKNGTIIVMATQEGYNETPSSNEWQPIGVFTAKLWASSDSGWPPIAGEPTLGEQDFLTLCDDSNPKSQWGSTERIGAKLKRHTAAWSVPEHDDWITYWFNLENTSGADLADLYFTAMWDIDVIAYGSTYMSNLVGYEGNDAVDNYTNPDEAGVVWNTASPSDGIPDEYDTVNYAGGDYPNSWPRNAAYMYSEDAAPGYIFCRLFGDKLPGETQTENALLVTGQHSWDIFNDPSTDNFMYGYQSDVGVYQEIAATPYDWRISPTIGPFNIASGENVDFYMGMMVTDAQGSANSLLEGRRNLDQLVADQKGDFKIASPPHSPLLSASHTMDGTNPSITLRWTPRWAPGKNAETDPDTLGSMVADFDGYMIYRSAIGFDTGWEVIRMFDKNANGQAMAYQPWGIHGGIENNNDGTPRLPAGVTQDRCVDFGQLPVDSPYYYRYVDTNVTAGKYYYYSVICYDFGYNAPAPEDRLTPVAGGKTFNQLNIRPLPLKTNTANDVIVVPNPYRGNAHWERWTNDGVREQEVYFMNLPSPCTIRVYTTSGDLVRTLKHTNSEFGAEPWNLTTEAGLLVTSGVYFFHVDSQDGKKIGKFAVLMGSSD